MPLSLFSRNHRTINIIINDYSIRLVELKSKQPLSVLRWEERYIPFGIITDGKIADYETLANILEECISDWKIQKRSIRFTVPDPFVIIRKISIPADVKDDEIHGYLYLELGSSIHLPFEEPVFDIHILSNGTEKRELLIFAAQEEHVTEYTALFQEVKLSPKAADISPLALYRLYDHLNMAEQDERLLMVQFDLNEVNLCIFEGSIPFFMHHIAVDADEEQWNIHLNKLGNYELSFLGEKDELLFLFEDQYKEISKLMDFYRYSIHQGKQQVSKILLNGDHPFLPRIADEMRKRYDVPISLIDGRSIVSAAENQFPRTHYLALGLALKEV